MVPLAVLIVLFGFCSAARISKRDTEVVGGSEDTLIGYLYDYKCPTGGGAFPWQICDKYVTCYGDSPAALMQCRYDYLFDLRWNGCNYPELTDCGNRTLPGGSTQVTVPTTTVVSGGNTPSFICPSLDGSFRNPYDCSSFYICSAGTPTLVVCQSGLVYNPTLEVCDYPSNVDCSTISTIPNENTTASTTTEKTTAFTTEKTTTAFTTAENTTAVMTTEKTTVRTEPPSFVCPSADGFYSNPADCASFYYCSNGAYSLVECKPGLLFNPDLGICDHPEAVQCNVSSTATVPISTTPIPSTMVSSSTAHLTTMVSNSTTQLSTMVSNSTTQKPLTTTAISSFSCNGLSDGIYSNPDNCNSFYQCSNGFLLEQSCAPGLAFNPDKLTCDYPQNFYPPCGTRFRCPESEGHFPHPTDCTSFYVCSHGESYQQFCNPPLVFNTAVSVCDFSYNVPPPCGTCANC